MYYERTIPLHGNPARALENARNIFMRQGFRLVDATATSFEAAGPGMQSNKQDPLRGASRVCMNAVNGELTLQAELGAARKMQRFIMFFPPALCIFLFVIFYFTTPPQAMKTNLGVCGFNMVIWFFISLVWVPAIRRSTERALDTAMDNAAQIARLEQQGL